MNFNYFTIPEILSLEITHLLNRTVLIPIITLIFLNQYINGIFTYTGWKLYYSIPVYPISLWLLMKVFQFTKMQLRKPLPN